MAEPGSSPEAGTPRWVKLGAAIVVVLGVLLVLLVVAGHGPGRHAGPAAGVAHV